MCKHRLYFLLVLLLFGCERSIPTEEKLSNQSKTLNPETENAESGGTVTNPYLTETNFIDMQTQPALSTNEGFSPTDRVQTENWLAEISEKRIAIAEETRPLIREEKEAEILRSLKALEGRMVTWAFPTQFSSDGKGIEIAVQDDPQRGIYYNIATTDYFSFLVPDVTTPGLRLGRELDADSFRKLQGGEAVKLRGVIRESKNRINLVGRIVEDPFGKAVILSEQLQPESVWSGRCILADGNAEYSIKLTLTARTDGSFSGTCVDIHGSASYPVSGTQDEKDIEFEVKRLPNDGEQFPYLATFRGTLTDGFMIQGTFGTGSFMLFLHDSDDRRSHGQPLQ